MREIAGDVALDDLLDLFAADSKYMMSNFIECLDCSRLVQWALAIRGAPSFTHVDPSVLDAMWWDEVPSRLGWLGAASYAGLDAEGKALARRAGRVRHLEATLGAPADAPMAVVSARAGSWTLLRRGVDLLLATRRSGSKEENTLLMRLDAEEVAGYRLHGEAFLDALAIRIHDILFSPRGGEFGARDLYRGRSGPRYREQASQAMRAWKVRQPRPGACEVCTSYWVTHVGRPVTIGESERFMAEVQRCRSCGAYWEVGAFSYPRVIGRARALQELPDLVSLEARLGIDFPEPPPV
ncbi:hypothetical protein [Agrococcus sp. ARC_14]|uniref:hypothetical protein n=1 Tax=Agrococcus sp. ARC_14 TaxID=2919927 RepID=UPI001F06D62D|nr:hypothetical protein [Agrococcus sp. ARC_14]MCH1882533.1 hypothetical protein [Agrococcus sp. ARC_14]